MIKAFQLFAFGNALILFAVEDATLLQIVTLILSFLTATIGSLLAYKVAIMNKAQIVSDKKVDLIGTAVEGVRLHTNQMSTDLATKSQEAGRWQGKAEEQEIIKTEKATEVAIAAKVAEGIREAATVNSTLASNVSDVKDTVEIIDDNVKGIKDAKDKLI